MALSTLRSTLDVKKSRNKHNRNILKAKDEYFRQKLDDNMDDSRKMWGVLNESLKVSKKKRTVPEYVDCNDPKTKSTTRMYDKKVIVDEMNAHFASVGEKLFEKLQPAHISFKSYI